MWRLKKRETQARNLTWEGFKYSGWVGVIEALEGMLRARAPEPVRCVPPVTHLGYFGGDTTASSWYYRYQGGRMMSGFYGQDAGSAGDGL